MPHYFPKNRERAGHDADLHCDEPTMVSDRNKCRPATEHLSMNPKPQHLPAPEGASGRIEELLAQRQWIQRLAQSLVGDPHVADDVAQQTMMMALTRPPKQASALRSWLAQVTRNFARRFHRDSQTRRRHESRRESLEPNDSNVDQDFLERAEEQHRVVGAVLRLSEPFRSTVIEHFFEGRPPLEIAKRQSIPAATVRSRLKRGLDRLRLELRPDQEKPWSRALLALAAGIGTGVIAARPAIAATRWAAAAAAALFFAGASWVIYTSSEPTPYPPALADASGDVAPNRTELDAPAVSPPADEQPTPTTASDETPTAVAPEATLPPNQDPASGRGEPSIGPAFATRVAVTLEVETPTKVRAKSWRVIESRIWLRDCEFDGPALGFVPQTVFEAKDNPLTIPLGGAVHLTGGDPEIAVLLRLEGKTRNGDDIRNVVYWAAETRIDPGQSTSIVLRRTERPHSFTLLFPRSNNGDAFTLQVAESLGGRTVWPSLARSEDSGAVVASRSSTIEIIVNRGRIEVVGLPKQWAVLNRVLPGSHGSARKKPVEARHISRRMSRGELQRWQGVMTPHHQVGELKIERCELVTPFPDIRIEGAGDEPPIEEATVAIRFQDQVVARAWWERDSWRWRHGLPGGRYSKNKSVIYDLDLPGYETPPVPGRVGRDKSITFHPRPTPDAVTVFGSLQLENGSARIPIVVSGRRADRTGGFVRRAYTTTDGQFEIHRCPPLRLGDISVEIDHDRLRQSLVARLQTRSKEAQAWLQISLTERPSRLPRRDGTRIDLGDWYYSVSVRDADGWLPLDEAIDADHARAVRQWGPDGRPPGGY